MDTRGGIRLQPNRNLGAHHRGARVSLRDREDNK
jgi:hypothetical protein